MLNLKPSDIITVITFVAGLSALGIPDAIGALIDSILSIWGIPAGHGAAIAKALGAASVLCGLLIRLYTNKTGAPTQSIVQNPTVVADGTTVVHANTPSVGTNTITLH